MRTELHEKSKQVIEKAREDKNIFQKIRLLLNVIAPENMEKKFAELRGLMF